jgi:hypothetical protein
MTIAISTEAFPIIVLLTIIVIGYSSFGTIEEVMMDWHYQ